MATNDYLDIAYQLLYSGFSVIPSGGGDKGKAPIIKWEPYQSRLPYKKEIEHWNHKDKPALWGIVTGSISGIVVVDVDGAEARAEVEATGITPHIETPRGGAHFYFHHPGYPIKTVAGLLPKIDIRADGGFVNVIGKRKDSIYRVIALPTRDNLIPWQRMPSFIAKEIKAGKISKDKPVTDDIISNGIRNSHLASLAGSMRRRGMSQEAIEAALLTENQVKCQPALIEHEVLGIARSVSRYPPEIKPLAEAKDKTTTLFLPPKVRKISTIPPEPVRWLWYPYLPFGKLSLLEGDPDVGKSWVSLAIATAVSLGIDLPQHTNDYKPAHGPVLIASAEDGLADTIRPRLDNMKANIDIIHAVDGLFTLDVAGFELLEDFIADTVPILVVIDPLVAYLSCEMDIHKANQVRYATARLARLAEKYGPAIVAIRHLTKSTSNKPIYRGLGSIDFAASARSVLMAGSDPDAPNIRGIIHIKHNLSPKGKAIGYELRDDNQFSWTGESNLTYARIVSASDNGSALQDAKRFLLEYLSDGPMPSNDCYEEAKNMDFSTRTLRRAKEQLNIESFKEGEPGKRGSGKWFLKLPDNGGKEDQDDQRFDDIKMTKGGR